MQVQQPANYEQKFKIITEMKEKFYKLAEEFKEAQAQLKKGVEARE